jgi:hypothetical protein
MKKLTKPQLAMLKRALERGFVMEPAGKPTAWILERAGLLKNIKRWCVTRCQHGGMVSESYSYQLELTDAGKARLQLEDSRG